MNWDVFFIALIAYVLGNVIGKSSLHKRELRYIQDIADRDKSIMLLNTQLVIKENEASITKRIELEVKKATHE